MSREKPQNENQAKSFKLVSTARDDVIAARIAAALARESRKKSAKISFKNQTKECAQWGAESFIHT